MYCFLQIIAYIGIWYASDASHRACACFCGSPSVSSRAVLYQSWLWQDRHRLINHTFSRCRSTSAQLHQHTAQPGLWTSTRVSAACKRKKRGTAHKGINTDTSPSCLYLDLLINSNGNPCAAILTVASLVRAVSWESVCHFVISFHLALILVGKPAHLFVVQWTSENTEWEETTTVDWLKIQDMVTVFHTLIQKLSSFHTDKTETKTLFNRSFTESVLSFPWYHGTVTYLWRTETNWCKLWTG